MADIDYHFVASILSLSRSLRNLFSTMITRFLTDVRVKFNPFSPRAKSARVFLSLLPPNARAEGMKIETRLLPRISTEPANIALTFSTSCARYKSSTQTDILDRGWKADESRPREHAVARSHGASGPTFSGPGSKGGASRELRGTGDIIVTVLYITCLGSHALGGVTRNQWSYIADIHTRRVFFCLSLILRLSRSSDLAPQYRLLRP